MSNKQPTPNPNNKLQAANSKLVKDKLLKANPRVFEGISTAKENEILQTVTVVEHSITHHSGPLPSPEVLDKYNTIIPNGADRIMAMAEKQQLHRMELESSTIKEQMYQSRRGQAFGLIIGIVAIAGSASCILFNHEIGGAILGAGGITGLVSVFVYGKKHQSKSLNDKA